METRWLYVTSEELPKLCEAAKGVCVIPLGAVEKHGLHLPLGTDIIKGSAIAYMASQLETVCIFPDFPFGDLSCGHPSTPAGTIALPMETELLLLEQLCDQIARYGFRKILLCNSHGGNNAMLDTFQERLYNKKKNYVVVITGPKLWSFRKMGEYLEENGPGSIPELTPEDEATVLKYYREKVSTGHGCMAETAMVMGCVPESVKLHRLGIETGKCQHKTDYLKEAYLQIRDGGWFEDYPNSYAAEVDPVDCTENIGKALVRREAERIAHAYKVLKEDENLLKWLDERQKGW